MWFDRKFYFREEHNIFPSIFERMWGTPLRLNRMLKSVDDAIASAKTDNKWSIKENVGHLIDLEPLWKGRLEDIRNGVEVMCPADLENRKTHEANHNQRSLVDLLVEFNECRNSTLDMIRGLDEETIFKSALHPRLNSPMRVMDLFLFTAEHDDHHLARIRTILTSQR